MDRVDRQIHEGGQGRSLAVAVPGRNHRDVSIRRGRLWWRQLTAGIGVATVLALAFLPHSEWTLAIVGGALGVVQVALSLPTSIGRRHARTDGVGTATAEARSLLARKVADQWAQELLARRVCGDDAIEVRWEMGDPSIMDDAASVASRTGLRGIGGQITRLRYAGDLTELVAGLRRLPVWRLVIVGPAGSGKTTAAIQLTMGLIEELRAEEPVPVMLDVADWDPTEDGLSAWVRRRLREDYPFLAVSGVLRDPVGGGHVLPVLDGADEMPPDARSRVLSALNELPVDRPFVLTCRTDEYTRAVREAGAVLRGVPVALLRPVGGEEALDFLQLTDRRWRAVRPRLRLEGGGGAIAAAFATPVMISLAQEVYRGRSRDPTELTDRSAFPDAPAIERHLLENLITSKYGNQSVQARRHFAWLAGFLDRTGTQDLAWWRLRHAAGPVRIGAAVAVALLSGLAFWLAQPDEPADIRIASGSCVAVVFGLLCGLLGRLRPFEEQTESAHPRVSGAASPAWRAVAWLAAQVRTGLWGGLLIGMPAGLLASFVPAVPVAVAFGAAWGIAVALVGSGAPAGSSGTAVVVTRLGGGLLAAPVAWFTAAVIIGFPQGPFIAYFVHLPGGLIDGTLLALRSGIGYGSAEQLRLGLPMAAVLGIVGGLTQAVADLTTRWRGPVTVAAGVGVGALTCGLLYGAAGLAPGAWLGLGTGLASWLACPSADRPRWTRRRDILVVSMPLLLRAAILGSLAGGIVAGLVWERLDWFNDLHSLALDVSVSLSGGLTFGMGVGLVGGLDFSRIDPPTRFSARLRGRSRALVPYLCAGLTFGILAWRVFGAAFNVMTRQALVGGLLFGAALGLTFWFRAPTREEPAVSPASTLAADRVTTLVSAILLGSTSGIAAWQVTSPLLGTMAGVVVAGTVVFSSSWLRFEVTRGWLATTGRLPVRVMSFLAGARQETVLRQAGAVYQFRHSRLREQLSPQRSASPSAVPHRLAGVRARVGTAAGVAAVTTTVLGVALLAPLSPITALPTPATAHPQLAELDLGPWVDPIGYDGCPNIPLDAHVYIRRPNVPPDAHFDLWLPATVYIDTICSLADLHQSRYLVGARITVHEGAAAGFAFVDAIATENSYWVLLTASGRYMVVVSERGSEGRSWYNKIIKYGYDPAIRPGRGQANDLAVLVVGQFIRIFVNGSYVDTATAPGGSPNAVGLAAAGRSGQEVDATFRNVRVALK